jgi:branched-chain amino acid transport system ATP-binding protein
MLELHAISVRFGGLHALGRIAFRCRRRNRRAGGPNGAGKTTLFNVISAVKPQRGTLRFGRRPGATARYGARAANRAHVPDPQPMHTLSVAENLTVAQRFGAAAWTPSPAEILDWSN